MRFYLDENLSHQVAIIGRARGLDITSSHELGRNSLPDEKQLRLAAEEGLCFVTCDYTDFTRLTRLFLENQWPHAGLLLVPASLPNRNFAAIVEALVTYAQDHEEGVPSYGIDFLTRRSGER